MIPFTQSRIVTEKGDEMAATVGKEARATFRFIAYCPLSALEAELRLI
jgi:hypothetical protein